MDSDFDAPEDDGAAAEDGDEPEEGDDKVFFLPFFSRVFLLLNMNLSPLHCSKRKRLVMWIR